MSEPLRDTTVTSSVAVRHDSNGNSYWREGGGFPQGQFPGQGRNVTGKALEITRSVLRDKASWSGTPPERMDSKLKRDETTGMLITVTVISVSSHHTDKYVCR